jgi:hypothetical protein
MCQRRQHARSLQHRAALSEAEAVYHRDSTVANEQSPRPPPSPPSVLPSSQTPLTLTVPAVARPVSRCLTITIEQPQAAETVVESTPRVHDSTRRRQIQHHPQCTVHSSGCSSIRSRGSGRLRLHPFHLIWPLLKLCQKTNISGQRLQIRILIVQNPTGLLRRYTCGKGLPQGANPHSQGMQEPVA